MPLSLPAPLWSHAGLGWSSREASAAAAPAPAPKVRAAAEEECRVGDWRSSGGSSCEDLGDSDRDITLETF